MAACNTNGMDSIHSVNCFTHASTQDYDSCLGCHTGVGAADDIERTTALACPAPHTRTPRTTTTTSMHAHAPGGWQSHTSLPRAGLSSSCPRRRCGPRGKGHACGRSQRTIQRQRSAADRGGKGTRAAA
eukprot:165041-Chlamydomonas_euryale.AAC.1